MAFHDLEDQNSLKIKITLKNLKRSQMSIFDLKYLTYVFLDKIAFIHFAQHTGIKLNKSQYFTK